MIAAEREDVALDELGADAVGVGQGARLGDRGGGKIEADDRVASAGQKSHVVTAPKARHRDASWRPRRALHELDKRRRGPAELPTLPPPRVEVGPEVGRAHTRPAVPSKCAL